jgi:protein-S-isoprenylcysteine O-methyltransferase Ste14
MERDRPRLVDMMTTPRLMLITIIGTLAYLGLAILGSGGFAAFFSHPALIALAVTLLVLAGVAVFSGGNLSPGVREDRANRWIIVAFGLIGLLDAYLPAYTDRKEFWTLDGDAIRWLGVVLFAAGGALRIWPVFVLGPRFSGLVAIQPGHPLVTTCLYSVIRHPSYLGLLVNSLGWALAFRSGVGVLLTGLLIPPLVARIRAEESLLHSQFGGEYEVYCNRTSRLIPGCIREANRRKTLCGLGLMGERTCHDQGCPCVIDPRQMPSRVPLFDFCSELFSKDPQSFGSDHNGSRVIHPPYPAVSEAVSAYGRSDGSRQVPSPFAPIEAWPTQDTPRFLSAGPQRRIEINSHPNKKIDAGVGDKTGFIR